MIGFWAFENFYTPNTYTEAKTADSSADFPETYLPSSQFDEIVHHNYYSLSYNEQYEQAEWVAYVLSKSHLTYDDRKRPYFIEDPYVQSKSADWRNYKGSGYDRGHLCPAGDRRFSEQAYNETFYTSNISPQDRDFNAGIWNRLEMQTRQWAKKYGELYIITGGILEPGLEEIGDEDVAVPDYFYKIIVKNVNGKTKALCFLMPHEEQTRPLHQFVVSIDEVEALSGIDFFQNLSKQDQANIEQGIDKKGWDF